MEFMDLLKEWLHLRDIYLGRGDGIALHRPDVKKRMDELEAEINKRMRGEL